MSELLLGLALINFAFFLGYKIGVAKSRKAIAVEAVSRQTTCPNPAAHTAFQDWLASHSLGTSPGKQAAP